MRLSGLHRPPQTAKEIDFPGSVDRSAIGFALAQLARRRLGLAAATLLMPERGSPARQKVLTALAQQGSCLFEPRGSDADVMVRRERPLDQGRQRGILEGAPPRHLDGPGAEPRSCLAEAGG